MMTATKMMASITPIKAPTEIEAMSVDDMLGVDALTDGFGGAAVVLAVVCLFFVVVSASSALVELIRSPVLNSGPVVKVSNIADAVLGIDG